MSDNPTQTRKDLNEHQHELSKQQQSHRAGLEMAASSQQERVENPDFLGKLQQAGLDSEVFDWIEDELGPLVAGSNIIGNRGEHYEEYAEMSLKNKVERVVSEADPGRLLRENPRMLAISQGLTGTKMHPDPTDNPDYLRPLTSREKRVIRDAAEPLTNQHSLSIEGRGLDAVSTVTVENKTVQEEEKESSSALSKAKGVFR